MTYNTRSECTLMEPITMDEFNKKVLCKLPAAPWIQIVEEKDFSSLCDMTSLAAAISAQVTVRDIEKARGYKHTNIYLIRIDTTEGVQFGVYPIVE